MRTFQSSFCASRFFFPEVTGQQLRRGKNKLSLAEEDDDENCRSFLLSNFSQYYQCGTGVHQALIGHDHVLDVAAERPDSDRQRNRHVSLRATPVLARSPPPPPPSPAPETFPTNFVAGDKQKLTRIMKKNTTFVNTAQAHPWVCP